MNINNIKGKHNLIALAKHHNIKGYSKFRRVGDLKNYLKYRLQSLPFANTPNDNEIFTQPRERYQKPFSNVNSDDNVFTQTRERYHPPSWTVNSNDVYRPPYSNVTGSNDDVFISNPLTTNDNYNEVFELSRSHQPPQIEYFVTNDSFVAIQNLVSENEQFQFTWATYTVKERISNDGVLDFNGLHEIIHQIIGKRKADAGFREGIDRIQLVIENDHLGTRAISTTVSTTINVGLVLNQFTDIMSSDQEVTLHGTTFSIQIVSMPSGGKRNKMINLAEDVRTKRCILQIKNNDNLCGPRAVIAALTYNTNIILNREINKNDITNIRKGRTLQLDLAVELCNKINHQPGEPFTLHSFKMVEKYLKNVRIKIISADNFNTVIYKGIGARDITIHIYHHDTHYDVITSMAAFYGMSDYCQLCDKAYKHKKHICKAICVTCKHSAHITPKSKKYCTDCNRYCYNEECFEQHKKPSLAATQPSPCQTVCKCLSCNIIYKRDEEHKCGFEFCKNCKKKVETKTHLCYMQWKRGKGGICVRRIDDKRKVHGCENCSPNNVYISHKYTGNEINDLMTDYMIENPNASVEEFDTYSTSLCKEKIDGYMYKCNKCKTFTTAPNKISFNCKNDECDIKKHTCTFTKKYIIYDFEANQETGEHRPNYVVAQYYNGTTFHFKNPDDFCKWLISREHRGYTVIAHNARSYDLYFIINYCMKNCIKPETIYNGCKIMYMTIRGLNMKFIDSYNFVSQPLSTFPKTFGLTELKKGYFPHFFNIEANQDYIGKIPDKNYYSYDTMKECDKCTSQSLRDVPTAPCTHWHTRNHFIQWHQERVVENYVFNFQKEMSVYCESDVDILRQAVIKLREQFLDICNIDPFQYITISSVAMAVFRYNHIKSETIAVLKDKNVEVYSKKSISWLKTLGDNVKHALNGGEEKILNRRVDGYDKTTNTVYQFHGCFWHGCPGCYKDDMINNKKRESMGDLYEKTKRFIQQLREHGYNVVEMWECEWEPTYKTIKKDFDIISPISPRDSYFGGRTNASKLHVRGKKLKYKDICSLYPTVMFYENFPVGHPIKISDPVEYNPKWFGIIKCQVQPPRKLYHPVLPIKTDKLIFTLCGKCADSKTRECNHSDIERRFTGTWTTAEINKAIEKGYKITYVYDVWHWKKRSNNMFKSYISKFLKIKLESSEWDSDFDSKEAYVAAIKKELNIDLDIDNITPNPVLRAIAKMLLNAFYGKFGQKRKMEHTEYVKDIQKFWEILLNDKLECVNLSMINKETVEFRYQTKDVWLEDPTKTNVIVAAFTTSYARLRLYEMLDKLDDKVAYYDTDSIIYIDDGSEGIKTGCMLGEWTDELNGDHIEEFLSTGPKSYAYKTTKGKIVCKVKGFTLNYKNAQKLNMNSMLDVLNNEVEDIILEYNQITKNRKTHTLTNTHIQKKFKLDYDKRVMQGKINDVIDTFPYGY